MNESKNPENFKKTTSGVTPEESKLSKQLDIAHITFKSSHSATPEITLELSDLNTQPPVLP